MSRSTPSTTSPEVNDNFVAGIDAGGTKVLIVDSISSNLHRFTAPNYPDLNAVLEEYFQKAKSRPRRVVIAMAGPRDDETGDVRPTNIDWPIFSPSEAARRFPGTEFITMHDLAGAAAGALHVSSINLRELKAGKAKNGGPVIAVAISTGVGVCVAIWDAPTKRRIFFSGEPGHVGFQPYTEAERRHLAHLFTKYDHPSVELAISGKFGVESWLEHSPELKSAPKLKAALDRALADDRPAGAVLLEFATEGASADQDAAHSILNNMGALVGNVLADYALTFRSTGGIYLTGSMALGLSEYWAEHTDFAKAFVRHGTPEHAPWKKELLGDIPIQLLVDPHITAIGALSLAKDS
jgi:glucokinase